MTKQPADETTTTPLPFEYTTIKNITLPILKDWSVDEIRYLRPTTKIVEKPKTNAKGEALKPLHVGNVINLMTGEECRLVYGEVLKGNLEDAYEDSSFIGVCFKIEKRIVEGKKYFNYIVEEIEVTEKKTTA